MLAILTVNRFYVFAQHNELELTQLRVDSIVKENVHDNIYWIAFCSLENKSKDPLTYWTMSCSWPAFFVIDKAEFQIEGFDCEIDEPDIWKLSSGETREIALRIFQKQPDTKLPKEIKVGFSCLHANTPLNLTRMTSEDNFIWSKKIILP